MSKILLVEDEMDLARLISGWLTRKRHLVEVVHDGETAWEQLRSSNFDVLLLDWMLPQMNGLELCRKYREVGGSAIVFIITAKDTIAEKDVCFSAGADDYLTKPFALEELTLRINARLRRTETINQKIFQIHDVTINLESHTVRKAGLDVSLMPTEFRLLQLLIKQPSRVFTAAELTAAIGRGSPRSTAIRGQIAHLRKHLDSPDKSSIITTVYGVGYKMGAGD